MCTKEQADLLGLSGWVRNLPDGKVEVFAEGEESTLKQLSDWLKKGPPMARVTDINVQDISPENYSNFKII